MLDLGMADPATGPRAFTTVALADEVLSVPELLDAYARTFTAADDATLVIYAPDADPAALERALVPLLSGLGLDGPGAPDMMGLAVPGAEGERALAAGADAVLSFIEPAGALAELPRVAPSALTELRARAERAWGHAAVDAPAAGSTSAQQRLDVPAPPAPHMDPPAPEAKREHLLELFKARGHRVLLESGTYLGETVEYFVPHAERIISVEVVPELFAGARQRFATDRNVELILGDALHLIPQLVEGLVDPPLIWLDGHYSEGVTGRGDEVEPAASILTLLGSVRKPAGTTVVVDDLRLFSMEPEFPSLDELVARARAGFPQARIRVGLDSLVIEA
jgi:hypothetical protein